MQPEVTLGAGVTALVSALREAIDQQDRTAIGRAYSDLLKAKHNKGLVRAKILELIRQWASSLAAGGAREPRVPKTDEAPGCQGQELR